MRMRTRAEALRELEEAERAEGRAREEQTQRADAEILRLEGELGRAGETIGKLRQDHSALKDLVILLSHDRAREESK